MHINSQLTKVGFTTRTATGLVWLVALALITIFVQPAQAQTLEVIYNFTGGPDGDQPQAGLSMDQAGNLYGTTCGELGIEGGGPSSSGTVFKLSRKGSGWVFTRLYAFQGGMDGAGPCSRVIIGPDGNLYGTTVTGGANPGDCKWRDSFKGCGTVFKLSPPPNVPSSVMGNWTKTVLHYFNWSDGAFPILGDLTFDQAGSIYGTTWAGGTGIDGTVYKLTATNDGWTESVLANFGSNEHAGEFPTAGVVIDAAGNIYGTTWYVAIGSCSSPLAYMGAVYQLTRSGPEWIENDLYCFQGSGDGEMPFAGVVFDDHGNLYGATTIDGPGDHDLRGGTLFKLDASQGWAFNLLYHFRGDGFSSTGTWTSLTPTDGPWGEKNFYGMTHRGGKYGGGTIFSWTYQCAGDTCDWQLNTLWDFGVVQNDGGGPISNLIFDADGYAYGTTTGGGTYNKGTVFRIYIGGAGQMKK